LSRLHRAGPSASLDKSDSVFDCQIKKAREHFPGLSFSWVSSFSYFQGALHFVSWAVRLDTGMPQSVLKLLASAHHAHVHHSSYFQSIRHVSFTLLVENITTFKDQSQAFVRNFKISRLLYLDSLNLT
jgi:hypothetical protein